MSDNAQLDEFGLIAELLAPLADNDAAAGLAMMRRGSVFRQGTS